MDAWTWLLFWLKSLKGSLIAFGVTLVLGFLSMGALGMVLYTVNIPIFKRWFPPEKEWNGDWVWPAMIAVGMGWSFAFVAAGVVNHHLANLQVPAPVRFALYGFILWLWAFLLWFLVLKSNLPGQAG